MYLLENTREGKAYWCSETMLEGSECCCSREAIQGLG